MTFSVWLPIELLKLIIHTPYVWAGGAVGIALGTLVVAGINSVTDPQDVVGLTIAGALLAVGWPVVVVVLTVVTPAALPFILGRRMALRKQKVANLAEYIKTGVMPPVASRPAHVPNIQGRPVL